jgi:hypothetical protein
VLSIRRINADKKDERKMLRRLVMMTSVCALLALLTLQASAQEITIRGHLERTVEAGGWLIIADVDETTTKYLLLDPQRFQKKSWFRTGATVEMTGEIKRDAVTIYQEGVPFKARTMRLIGRQKEKGKR